MNDRLVMPVVAVRASRLNSRRQQMLDAAAALFGARGYHGTSVRDIAAATQMTPGAIYSHFPSKAELLVAVYEEGIGRITAMVDAAAAREKEPQRKLRAICEAHLTMLLGRSDYAQVVVRVLPQDVPDAAPRLVALRDEYENRFRALVPDRHLRLLLLGAMNAALFWYQPKGDAPATIARRFLSLLGVRHG